MRLQGRFDDRRACGRAGRGARRRRAPHASCTGQEQVHPRRGAMRSHAPPHPPRHPPPRPAAAPTVRRAQDGLGAGRVLAAGQGGRGALHGLCLQLPPTRRSDTRGDVCHAVPLRRHGDGLRPDGAGRAGAGEAGGGCGRRCRVAGGGSWWFWGMWAGQEVSGPSRMRCMGGCWTGLVVCCAPATGRRGPARGGGRMHSSWAWRVRAGDRVRVNQAEAGERGGTANAQAARAPTGTVPPPRPRL